MYTLGDIFYEDEDYVNKVNYCNKSKNLYIEVLEPDDKGRRFTIKEKVETEEDILNNLRDRREIECFSVINRGQLWYDTLTAEQKQELQTWYNNWLDVTETKSIPEKPEWLI